MDKQNKIKALQSLEPDAHLVGLMKRGLWYRPEDKGYTSNPDEAGRYTLEEAKKREYLKGDQPTTIQPFPPKDYPNSYDAIIPLIQKQPEGIQLKVAEQLYLMGQRKVCTVIQLFATKSEVLCDMLLKATGKWEE